MENNYNDIDKNLKNIESEKFSQNILFFFLFMAFIASIVCVMFDIVELQSWIGVILVLGLCVMVLVYLTLGRQKMLFKTSKDLLYIVREQNSQNINLTNELKTKTTVLNELMEENERMMHAKNAQKISSEKEKYYNQKYGRRKK